MRVLNPWTRPRRETQAVQGHTQGSFTCIERLRVQRHRQQTSRNVSDRVKTEDVKYDMVPEYCTSTLTWGLSRGAPFSDQGPALLALGTAVQAYREETLPSYGCKNESRQRSQSEGAT